MHLGPQLFIVDPQLADIFPKFNLKTIQTTGKVGFDSFHIKPSVLNFGLELDANLLEFQSHRLKIGLGRIIRPNDCHVRF